MTVVRMPLIDDPTDNLILYCILAHARSHPPSRKAFLSGNSKDFGDRVGTGSTCTAGVEQILLGQRNNAWSWFDFPGQS